MEYPYYIVPQVEEYRKLDPNSEEAKKLSRIIATNVGDYASVRLILGIDPPDFARFYPDMETSTPTTMDTIDTFLDKFGTNLPADPLAVSLGGYVLEEDVDEPKEIKEAKEAEISEETEEIIENQAPEEPQIELGDLIKERRYDDALQFIERQNLNNPEKSIYFAHQNRFIRKLMAIEKYRNQTKG